MAGQIDDIIANANNYLTQVTMKAHCHFIMAEIADRKRLRLGIFVTLFSSVVGTTIFAAISTGNEPTWIQVATGTMSVAAAVLAAFQTFFHFDEDSRQNRIAAGRYEKIRYAIDSFLLTFTADCTQRDQALAALKAITDDLEKVIEFAPSVPDDVYDKVVRKET
jgi:hypothetical protein